MFRVMLRLSHTNVGTVVHEVYSYDSKEEAFERVRDLEYNNEIYDIDYYVADEDYKPVILEAECKVND